MKYFTALVLLGLSSMMATPIKTNAAWFGPDDYDECILSGMRGVNSDTAAALVMVSCRDKFGEPKPAQNRSLFGPRDYNACILENMKDVKSDSAAALIMISCRNKFPERK